MCFTASGVTLSRCAAARRQRSWNGDVARPRAVPPDMSNYPAANAYPQYPGCLLASRCCCQRKRNAFRARWRFAVEHHGIGALDVSRFETSPAAAAAAPSRSIEMALAAKALASSGTFVRFVAAAQRALRQRVDARAAPVNISCSTISTSRLDMQVAGRNVRCVSRGTCVTQMHMRARRTGYLLWTALLSLRYLILRCLQLVSLCYISAPVWFLPALSWVALPVIRCCKISAWFLAYGDRSYQEALRLSARFTFFKSAMNSLLWRSLRHFVSRAAANRRI